MRHVEEIIHHNWRWGALKVMYTSVWGLYLLLMLNLIHKNWRHFCNISAAVCRCYCSLIKVEFQFAWLFTLESPIIWVLSFQLFCRLHVIIFQSFRWLWVCSQISKFWTCLIPKSTAFRFFDLTRFTWSLVTVLGYSQSTPNTSYGLSRSSTCSYFLSWLWLLGTTDHKLIQI